jgi:hypothetical protein
LYECEKKGFARKGIRKFVKTKDAEKSKLDGKYSKHGTAEGVHPRGDGKYAQLAEGGGDRGAAWRM